MPLPLKQELTSSDRLAVAALARVDPRAVRRYLDGAKQHPATVDAIERALRKLDHVAPPPRPPSAEDRTLDLPFTDTPNKEG